VHSLMNQIPFNLNYPFLPLLIFATQRLNGPVRSSSSLMHVRDGTKQILPNPRIIRVLYSMLLANTPYSRCDVRVPCRGHAREQVMLYLKVESTGNHSSNESTISRGSFHLRLEPTHRLTSFTEGSGGITIRMLKVV
jgi:hypothetical protein